MCFFQALCFLEGEDHAVNHGEIPENRCDPQHRCHAIKESANDQENYAFRPFKETDLALRNGILGPGPGIAGHNAGNHYDRGQNDIRRTIDVAVVDEQADQKGEIRVTVNDTVKESTESRHLAGLARDTAIDHVEEARTYDDEARLPECASGQQPCCTDIDDQADKCENVRMDLRQSQSVDDLDEQNVAGSSNCAGPCSFRFHLREKAVWLRLP